MLHVLLQIVVWIFVVLFFAGLLSLAVWMVMYGIFNKDFD